MNLRTKMLIGLVILVGVAGLALSYLLSATATPAN